VLVLAAAIAIADLCGGPPEPVAPPDPADSAAYTEVADAALAAEDLRTAAIAYRKAIALDGANRHAADGLAALCGTSAAAAEAADAATLTAATARYRAGDRTGAAAALADLARGRGGSAAGAHFFLGLIALERHDTGTAIRELEAARKDPDYQALATALLRIAHRDGTVAAALLVESEVDSNPQLVPDTPPSGTMDSAPATDVDLLTVATFTARPEPWLAVRNTLTWRNLRAQSALDFLAEDLEVSAELARGPHHLAVRGGGDFDLLAGTAYLLAGGAAVAYRLDGDGASAVATYSVRRRAYLRDSEQPFNGWVHSGDAGAIVALGAGVQLDARAVIRRELTADLAFTHLYTGVQLAVRTRSAARVRFTASVTAGYARHDGAEPDGALRRDTAFAAGADLEVDLGDHVSAVAGASAAYNQSTLDDFIYNQVIARLGLLIAWGGL